MAQRCRVCAHQKTQEIDKAIVEGLPHTQIADMYGINNQSVRLHAQNHLPAKLVKAVEKDESKHAEGILEGINGLLERTKRILDEAEQKGYNRLALEAIRESRSTYELLSRIAATLEKYRTKEVDNGKEDAEQAHAEGLKALSTPELQTYIQLQGKIKQANPDIVLDQESQWIIESMTVAQPDKVDNNDNTDAESRQNADSQLKNTYKEQGGEPDDQELDNLDNLDNLDSEPAPGDVIGHTESGYEIRKPYPESHKYWDRHRDELIAGVSRYNKR
ncbi:MAG: hypothetical protein WD097_09805 [Balneolales bacterium]